MFRDQSHEQSTLPIPTPISTIIPYTHPSTHPYRNRPSRSASDQKRTAAPRGFRHTRRPPRPRRLATLASHRPRRNHLHGPLPGSPGKRHRFGGIGLFPRNRRTWFIFIVHVDFRCDFYASEGQRHSKHHSFYDRMVIDPSPSKSIANGRFNPSFLL